jgi:LPS-assembly protein
MMLVGISAVYAQKEVSPAEITGDEVEFDLKAHKVIAIGNVSIIKGDARLTCDRAEFSRDTEVAIASGRVVLRRPGETVEGDSLVFNFKTMTGDFNKPIFTAPPFYGAGKSVEKIGENHFQIRDGYLSTCDFDDPQSRISASVIDVYPGDRAVARDMIFKVGKVPVFFWPKYTQDLKDRSSIVRLMPGYSSEWGGFLLSRWRFDKNENFKTFVHVDYRERKDLAWGIDNQYDSQSFGKGLIRTYYMNERKISSERIWDDRLTPTVEQERYKVEWRHRWQIDETTSMISQYYKMSDALILKDYFEYESERDKTPPSYMIATKALPYGMVTARTDYRVNRFTSTVDRLPEVGYTLPNLEIFDSGFYFKNSTTASNLVKKDASPAEYVHTNRLHMDNEVSYPAKVSFIELRPFVGTRQTYYRHTKDGDMSDAVRGVFRTGADASTKFYRVYDFSTDAFNLDINDLRHVITPSVAYEYQHTPTILRSRLDRYDSVDTLERRHRAVLGLENKLQTKRNGVSADLVRAIVSTDYALTEDVALPSSFNNVNFKLELMPYSWMGLYFDVDYDPQNTQLETVNSDLYINDANDVWYLRLGDRYHYDVDHQFETEVGWRVNPKWSVIVNQRYDFASGQSKEQGIALRRDLHSWYMDIFAKSENNNGTEILLVFSLKGFEDVFLSGGRTFFSGGSERPGARE